MGNKCTGSNFRKKQIKQNNHDLNNFINQVTYAPDLKMGTKVFDDDQQIVQTVKQTSKDCKIDIEIKAQRSMIKLKQEIMLPAMCSIKTEGGQRTSVDLICVIDVSGSMAGNKIQLVKTTMKYLIDALTPSDRLSIIAFESSGTRLCGLKCVTKENVDVLNRYIDNLKAGGGTDINAGLNLALKTIKERKFTNKITSIFLLSDGQDRGAQITFKETLKRQNDYLGIFSIHSFGFGMDHDENLMTNICKLKDGSFYFIKQLATLDEAFSNALGGIISMVATDVVINVSNISQDLVQGIKIQKLYGSMWQKINQRRFKIKIPQLMSGISKDYVFEIKIPLINAKVGDLNRNHKILQATYTAKGMDNSILQGQSQFKITLINSNEKLHQINQNIDVIQNHLRVMTSEAIEQNMKKAESKNFKEVEASLDGMINLIQSNKKVNKQKLNYLVKDLKNIQQKCKSQDIFNRQGKKFMMSAQIIHQSQNNYQYSNSLQRQMVEASKSRMHILPDNPNNTKK